MTVGESATKLVEVFDRVREDDFFATVVHERDGDAGKLQNLVRVLDGDEELELSFVSGNLKVGRVSVDEKLRAPEDVGVLFWIRDDPLDDVFGDDLDFPGGHLGDLVSSTGQKRVQRPKGIIGVAELICRFFKEENWNFIKMVHKS